MGNVYSAQNIAAYLIYELNEQNTFINAVALQLLLAEVEIEWNRQYGHSAFSEKIYSISENNYVVKEVYEAYKECEDHHLEVPAKEWFLEYGQFQLVYRTYGVPAFKAQEKIFVHNIINKYRETILKKAS